MSAPAIARDRTLRHLLTETDRFVLVAELVTSRGLITERSGRRTLGLAQALAEHPRIDALSITDNPGGNAMLSADTIGTDMIGRGQEVIIHLSCKDWNRNALESRGWKLSSEGFDNVLALSGDYPVTGHRGLAKPVFDIDSVGLLRLFAEAHSPGRDGEVLGVLLGQWRSLATRRALFNTVETSVLATFVALESFTYVTPPRCAISSRRCLTPANERRPERTASSSTPRARHAAAAAIAFSRLWRPRRRSSRAASRSRPFQHSSPSRSRSAASGPAPKPTRRADPARASSAASCAPFAPCPASSELGSTATSSARWRAKALALAATYAASVR